MLWKTYNHVTSFKYFGQRWGFLGSFARASKSNVSLDKHTLKIEHSAVKIYT